MKPNWVRLDELSGLRSMRIFRGEIHPECLAMLDPRDIARCCGVTERTARQWKQRGYASPAASRLLALAIGEMEVFAGKTWRGWTMKRDGALVSEDGQVWDSGRLSAWWIERQQIPELQRLVDAYRRAGPHVDPAKLEALEQAAKTAQHAAYLLAQCYPRAATNAANGENEPMAPSVLVS